MHWQHDKAQIQIPFVLYMIDGPIKPVTNHKNREVHTASQHKDHNKIIIAAHQTAYYAVVRGMEEI